MDELGDDPTQAYGAPQSFGAPQPGNPLPYGTGQPYAPPATYQPYAQPTVEVLGTAGAADPAHRPGRRRAGLVAGLATFAVVLAAGAGYAAWQAFDGGGAHPDDVLPATTLAVAELDLDPSAGQKLELYRLLQRFPDSAGLKSSDKTVEDWLLRRLSEDGSSGGLDFAKDVEPWLGKRFAVAAVPAADGPAGVVVVLQETDEKAASAAMAKLRASSGGQPIGYAFLDGFLVASPGSATTAQRAVDAARTSPLSKDARFSSDVATLGGDQVVTAWVDADKAGAALSAVAKQTLGGLDLGAGGSGGLPSDLGLASWKGRWALGAHATDSSVEVTMQSFGGAPAPPVPPVALDGVLPDAWAVMALSGADKRIADAWKEAGAGGSGPGGAALSALTAEAQQLGLTLPGDLEALLGSQLAVSVAGDPSGEPTVLASSLSSDPQRAKQVLDKLLANAGPEAPPIATAVRDGHLLVGSSQAAVAGGGKGSVQDSDLFRRAVADPGSAQLLVYVDLGKVWATMDSPDPELKQLAAVGLSTHSSGDRSSMVLRLVFS